MRKIAESIDFTQIGFYQSILESNGIATEIRNAVSSSIMGEIPFAEVFPELWVVDDAQAEEAHRLIDEHTQAPPAGAEDWVCSRCGEKIPKEFGACWKCGEPESGAT